MAILILVDFIYFDQYDHCVPGFKIFKINGSLLQNFIMKMK